ncbi:hypothetical protein BD626DRAFT_483206 [Schizophyllum amplum]|uniref:Uncharacterized protein n=1 Tax=Schizophyllum amplum TaxID=97359 RepID=A0A550CP67_9AGAR|nr:hypothetical protein BD626DRAFT_483206 [Auriculariopsis ampla]
MTTRRYDLTGIFPVLELIQLMHDSVRPVLERVRRTIILISRAGHDERLRVALNGAVHVLSAQVDEIAEVFAELRLLFLALDRAIRLDADWKSNIAQMRTHYDAYTEHLGRLSAQTEQIAGPLVEFEQYLLEYYAYPPVLHYTFLNIWLPLAQRWQMAPPDPRDEILLTISDIIGCARSMIRCNAELSQQALDLSPAAMSHFDFTALEYIRGLPTDERKAASDIVFEIPASLWESSSDLAGQARGLSNSVARHLGDGPG